MNIGENLKKLIKARGITVKKFEEDCEVGHGYIRATIMRNTIPKADKIRRFAEYFDVPEYVILGEEPAESTGGVIIPILGRVAAGYPISAVENIIGQEEISKKLASTGEFFALRIKGDSMSPNLHNGDVVIVRQQNDAEDGDIVIAIVNGDDGVCKRVKRYKDSLSLISDNPAYPPMMFSHEEIDTVPVTIAGKVVELRREL